MNTCCACSVNDYYGKPLESLLRFVMPYAPEMSVGMAMDLLRQAYIRFARLSHSLTVELVQDKQAGVVDYDMTPPDNYAIYNVVSICDTIFRSVDYWHYNTQYNARFTVYENTRIELWDEPTQDETDGLKIIVRLIPKECIDTIPEFILTPFGWGIAQWALRNVFLIPNKEWTSPVQARVCEIEFNRTVMQAKNLADAGRKEGPLEANPVRII